MSPSPPPTPAPAILPILFLLSSLFSAATSSEITALLLLKSSLQPTNPRLFSTWLPTATSPCNFTGVSCDGGQNSVTAIDLSNSNLSGSSLPFSSICTTLPSLQKLAFGFNSLSGNLSSSDLQKCTNLRYLDVGNNAFSGSFPDISPMIQLEQLYLNSSGFSGVFPWNSLSGMSNLTALSVGDNPFAATDFPAVITKLTNLISLYMANCSISGNIPSSIESLSKLEDLQISGNNISGEIPPEITGLKNLWRVEIYDNFLNGTIPAGFGGLTNLRFLDLSNNSLHGNLSELGNLNKLESLQMFYNLFTGELPAEFGEFKNLVNISLYNNTLTGPLPKKLGSWAKFNYIDVSSNAFTGPIPPEMCSKGTMQKLLMLENKFTGEIPASYGNCKTLLRFRVSDNSLTGTVPAGIWGLPEVDIIDIADNFLEGPITSDIGNAKSLGKLLASNNRLSGPLPAEISGAVSLVAIDLTTNQLNGHIPETIGQLQNLNSLYLDNNRFSGGIPDSWASSSSHLNEMNLAHNSLSGQIPASLGSLQTLYSLNLSYNDLSGQIPTTLSSIRLSLLDLSDNDLEGPIPDSLVMEAYNRSFLGNKGLCSVNGLLLRPCRATNSSHVNTLVISLVVGIIVVIALTGCCYACLKIKAAHKDRALSFKDGSSWDMKSYHVVRFAEDEILDSVKNENLVGKGGCGSVYKAKLRDGQELAVKHIWTVDSGGQGKVRSETPMLSRSRRSKEFDTEVGLLSSIRHVNVVKLYCSITSEDSSLLVYEYLPNGSLWDRLHMCKTVALDWPRRHEIALGAAKGLEYLHHGCDRPVIHRDIKSSNILLDDKLKSKIADFGLAKIVHNASIGKESTHVIAGTHGYIAPEYGYTYKVNEKSDVYSFGVVLMELVTGKRPIQPEFGEGKDIVSWVSSNLKSKESVMSMVDSSIPEPVKEEAIKVLKIAILCTTRLPDLRPSMRTVVEMLENADPCRLEGIVIGKDGSVKKGESL